jgi:hypothetical protein
MSRYPCLVYFWILSPIVSASLQYLGFLLVRACVLARSCIYSYVPACMRWFARTCVCVELVIFISYAQEGHRKRGLYLLAVSGRSDPTDSRRRYFSCASGIYMILGRGGQFRQVICVRRIYSGYIAVARHWISEYLVCFSLTSWLYSWTYRRTMLMSLCPKIRCRLKGSPPCTIQLRANEWRSMCGVTVAVIPAFFAYWCRSATQRL